ncbi:hypothetical protein BAE44_0019548 [Dichanthelium oligosanthes]|uniref:Beta-glucuronosyltransferase GlcAT14A n=1 Tax=Dichanthelium oligosanthes TaxID=888268 RepID=A0A1E5V2U0_9POAL|nr:hypothetical protein BAE44_0019548 [Dichanthelium oligosanthes]
MGAADKWLLPLVSVSFVSLLLFLSALSGFSASSALFARLPPPSYVRRGAAAPPSFAYLLAGGRGDGSKLLRLLLAVYHPRNRYLLHLSADAPGSERAELAAAVARAAPAVRAFGNVDVVGRPAAGTPMGSSGLATTLRAAAAMLRLDAEWDWFVTLHAADYPLLTQDGPRHHYPTRIRKPSGAASLVSFSDYLMGPLDVLFFHLMIPLAVTQCQSLIAGL